MTTKWTCVSVAAALLASAPVTVNAATIYVAAGGNLQQGLDSAQPGDTILLQEGAEFVGNFVLPVKTGVGWITLRTSAPDSVLPPAGVRIRPADAPLLARLRSPTLDRAALRTAPGAHHWQIRYLEFAANPWGQSDIIQLGDGSSIQNTLELVPHDFILSHLYIHGDPAIGQKRGIALNAAFVTIADSYIADCKGVGQDTQAIGGWNGPGPYTIENNYLEGAGENVMFGGADPAIPGLVADGITFRRNYVSRPMSWRNPIISTPEGLTGATEAGGALNAGVYAYRVVARRLVSQFTMGRSTASAEIAVSASTDGSAVRLRWDPVPDATEYRVYGRASGAQSMYWRVTATEFVDTGAPGTSENVPTTAGTLWTVKNLFELKSARNVVVEDNVFENHWKESQPGYSIVLTPRNSGGTCTWCVVEHVRFEWNIVRNVAAGVNVLGYDAASRPTRQTNNLAFRHNVFTGLTTALGGNGWFMQLGDEPRDIILEHNTIDANGTTLVYVYGGTSTDPREVYGFQMVANAARHGSYGINGASFSYGNGILTNYYPGNIFLANYLAGASASRYPAGTFVSGVFTDQFLDSFVGDYTVRTDSLLKGAAPDGSEVGANYPLLVLRLDGVVSGVPPGTPPPPPPPPTPPSASFTLNCTHLDCAYSDTSLRGSGALTGRSWTFGDGGTSALASGTHSYTAAGTYTVTLTVVDGNGLSDSESRTVTVAAAPPVNASPTAAFDYTCVELTCAFTDRSTDTDGTIAAWAWTFVSVGSANTQSPSFRFPSPGTYQVALMVTDNGGATSTATRAIEVTALVHNAFVATTTQTGGNPSSPSNWKATIVTAVHTSDEQPVSGATVVAAWSGAWNKTVSCVTNSMGQCPFTTGALSMQKTSVTLMVTKVSVPLSTLQFGRESQPDGKWKRDVDYRSQTVVDVQFVGALSSSPPIRSWVRRGLNHT